MTHPERRKKRSEDLLKKQGIPINPSLPAIESEEEITPRSAGDIAKRAIVLCAVALRGQGFKQQEVISLLSGKDVLALATPEEKKFLLKKRPARQELLDRLLDLQGRGEIDESGQRELKALMAECGRHVLRRAEVVALLIARGHSAPQPLPIPTKS